MTQIMPRKLISPSPQRQQPPRRRLSSNGVLRNFDLELAAGLLGNLVASLPTIGLRNEGLTLPVVFCEKLFCEEIFYLRVVAKYLEIGGLKQLRTIVADLVANILLHHRAGKIALADSLT
jgi:hypothetical protein